MNLGIQLSLWTHPCDRILAMMDASRFIVSIFNMISLINNIFLANIWLFPYTGLFL